MIAQYRKDAVRGLQFPQNLSHAIHVMIALVHKVPGQDHQVGTLLLGQPDCFFEIRGSDFSAAMKIGQMSDAEAGESRWQIGDSNRDLIQLQPGRLDIPPVANTGPISPDPAGPMPSTTLGPSLATQPPYDMLNHSRFNPS